MRKRKPHSFTIVLQRALSLPKLWKKIKEANINLSYNDLKKILEHYQITKQTHKPKEFSNVFASTTTHPLQSTQLDIMVYDRYQYHNYKYVIGLIDVYSRFVVARPLTNMRMSTILSNLKEMCENLSQSGSKPKQAGSKKVKYPENMNLDNQFNVKPFVDFFTEQGTKLYFSQPSQPHKNALIERFWRTLALLLQRMRHGIKNFDWPKALPDAIENYNTTFHRSIKASPLELIEGKKDSPIERKVVESVLKKGMRVRVKTKKDIYSKGDIQTLDSIPDVPDKENAPAYNPFWSMINNKVMGKFKFEVLGIGEIGASQPKSNSILVVDKQDNIKTKMTAKCVYGCCIDDDAPKRNKKAEKKEGGVMLMDKDKTLVRHSDMINCVKHGSRLMSMLSRLIPFKKVVRKLTKWPHENT